MPSELLSYRLRIGQSELTKPAQLDRKSTRLNSSHRCISYAVFCLKKKNGITAAVEAAEAGYDVYLVEKNQYLGGRVAQLHHYFPKLCPPLCGLEINFRRIKSNSRVRFFTMAEVQFFFFYEADLHRNLHSFPTRRSSD